MPSAITAIFAANRAKKCEIFVKFNGFCKFIRCVENGARNLFTVHKKEGGDSAREVQRRGCLKKQPLLNYIYVTGSTKKRFGENDQKRGVLGILATQKRKCVKFNLKLRKN